jgi:hypothetical protein
MDKIILDENGNIIINDSMSDELKEKIALYNSFGGEGEGEEEESLMDDFDSDNSYIGNDDDDDDDVPEEVEEKVNQEELDSLNDLFS